MTKLMFDLLASKKLHTFSSFFILLLILLFCNHQVGRKNIQGVGLENVELLFRRGEIYTTSCRLTNDTAKASFDMGRNAHITFVARFTNYQGETCLQKTVLGSIFDNLKSMQYHNII